MAEAEGPRRDPVVAVDVGGRQFWLLGTAHVSAESVDEVREEIRRRRPAVVAVELCEARRRALRNRDEWTKLNLFEVIRQRQTLLLISQLALTAWQRRIGAHLGVEPGAELVAAMETAEEIGAEVLLIDRDVRTTLRRAWAALGLWRRIEFFGLLLEALVVAPDVTEEDVEKLKEGDELSGLLEQLGGVVPELVDVVIGERDKYMAAKLLAGVTEGPALAVVGAGHVPGLTAALNEPPVAPDTLEAVPPRARWPKALAWLLPVLVLAAFGVGLSRQAGHDVHEMLTAWILPNSLFAALLTALAGGRPASVLAALVASPITSLNPMLGAGMVVGLLEAWLRKPTVEDCERLAEDIQTVRGLYRNGVTRVLLVFVGASLGSALGAWVGLGWLAALLGR